VGKEKNVRDGKSEGIGLRRAGSRKKIGIAANFGEMRNYSGSQGVNGRWASQVP